MEWTSSKYTKKTHINYFLSPKIDIIVDEMHPGELEKIDGNEVVFGLNLSIKNVSSVGEDNVLGLGEPVKT